MYSFSCSYGKVHKGKTCHPLKIRLEEHQKAICPGEIKKMSMSEHLLKEKGSNLALWDEVTKIDREEHWRIRYLKEAVNMLGYINLLSRINIKMNTIIGTNNQKGL